MLFLVLPVHPENGTKAFGGKHFIPNESWKTKLTILIKRFDSKLNYT